MKQVIMSKLAIDNIDFDVAQKLFENENPDKNICIFYRLNGYGPDPKINDGVNHKIKDSFSQSILSKATDNQEDFLLVDATGFQEGEMGGGSFIPELLIPLTFAFTFIISSISQGFFSELGKDVYGWIKSLINKKVIRTNKGNIQVICKINSKKTFTFVFFDYFDEKTFVTAWKKMFQVKKVKDIDGVINTTCIVVYNPVKKRWTAID